jgi:hypothetical protein
VQNALIAIENRIETAEELQRDILAPVDVAPFEKLIAQQAQEVRKLFDQAVQKAVNEAVRRMVPEIAKQLQDTLLLQQQSGLVSMYRGGVKRCWNPYYSIGCSFCEFASGKYSVSMRNLSYFSW